jgi:hypothetical protein
MRTQANNVALGFLLLLASLVANNVAGAQLLAVPTLHTTDLFRPHNDPDDHWDLASLSAERNPTASPGCSELQILRVET